MAGVKEEYAEPYLERLVDRNGWTVAVYTQEKITSSNKFESAFSDKLLVQALTLNRIRLAIILCIFTSRPLKKQTVSYPADVYHLQYRDIFR